jgi:hypothetical protein
MPKAVMDWLVLPCPAFLPELLQSSAPRLRDVVELSSARIAEDVRAEAAGAFLNHFAGGLGDRDRHPGMVFLGTEPDRTVGLKPRNVERGHIVNSQARVEREFHERSHILAAPFPVVVAVLADRDNLPAVFFLGPFTPGPAIGAAAVEHPLDFLVAEGAARLVFLALFLTSPVSPIAPAFNAGWIFFEVAGLNEKLEKSLQSSQPVCPCSGFSHLPALDQFAHKVIVEFLDKAQSLVVGEFQQGAVFAFLAVVAPF